MHMIPRISAHAGKTHTQFGLSSQKRASPFLNAQFPEKPGQINENI